MVHAAVRYLRGKEIDPSARGFLWLPPSPDVQENIEGLAFYHRPHHFLLPHGYLGRDFYLQVRTGTKESVVSWLRINDSLYSYDLRTYSKGGLVGVNTPDVAFDELRTLASEAGLGFAVSIRYPKLYRVAFGNATLLLWISLLVQVTSGNDRFAGAVFVDAANSRISGVVTARLGETPDTFKERLINAINQSYIGFLSNQTIGGEAAVGYITNGTVERTAWVLLQPDNQYAIVLYIQNQTDLVFVLVTEASVATKEDFYTASILKEGDRVNIEARYDKDHQAWLAYKVDFA